MIKVIGEALEARKRITCENCAAILEYVPADMKRYDGKDYLGGSDGCEWIDCPRCSEEVVIRSW